MRPGVDTLMGRYRWLLTRRIGLHEMRSNRGLTRNLQAVKWTLSLIDETQAGQRQERCQYKCWMGVANISGGEDTLSNEGLLYFKTNFEKIFSARMQIMFS